MPLSIPTIKPMAISSITFPTQQQFSTAPSPPQSPTYYLQHYIPRNPSMNSLQPPLSLQERRQRNKAASAKYRAKKNHQYGEMRHLISSLTKENDLLLRQLDHVRRDNNRLKATCDKLRGKMLAEKMLKKLLNDENGDQLKKFEQDIEQEEEWETYDH
ncbi:hypothetical protein MFLAVUS_011113 [Mucor flavus]|uniref:BZIP domain-containing protein n=1 Tax=Mucor flavus TaxID=439312 RepID=A0ABP9ZEM6_9FUNG